MLQTIRERAQGWIAWVIVILISIPFALWGIQEYLGVGSAPVKVSVNGREITEREFERSYRQFRGELRQRLGKAYRPELVDDARLREEVLDSLIRSELILQATAQMRMRAGKEMIRNTIRSIPLFQVGGRFDKAAYENGTRRQGLTPSGFEQQLQRSIVSEQLTKAITGSELVTRKELEEAIRLSGQRRELDYLIIPAQKLLGDLQVSDSDVSAYYTSNQSDYLAPERVKVEYIELDINRIAHSLQVNDDNLLAYYDQHKKEYVVPERRRASHILIVAEETADEGAIAAARKSAESALNRVREGEDFALVAKEVSQDPGSAESGGDLGFFEKGVMAQAFEDAAFSLSQDAVSDLIRTEFGFHIIKLQDVRAESGKSFAEVREEVLAAYRKEEAGRLFYEYAERLGDLAYDDPDSLEPASETLGVAIKRSDWMGRDGGKGVLAAGTVAGAAFSEDVLVQGHNSELIDLGAEHVLVLRVEEHEEASTRPLETVKDEIVALLKEREGAKRTKQSGKELLTSLRGGATLTQVASENGLELHNAGDVRRNNRDLPWGVIEELFRLPHPEGNTVYGGAALGSGDYAVLALHKVTPGSPDDLADGEEKRLKDSMAKNRGQSSFSQLVDTMRAGAEIIFPDKN